MSSVAYQLTFGNTYSVPGLHAGCGCIGEIADRSVIHPDCDEVVCLAFVATLDFGPRGGATCRAQHGCNGVAAPVANLVSTETTVQPARRRPDHAGIALLLD